MKIEQKTLSTIHWTNPKQNGFMTIWNDIAEQLHLKIVMTEWDYTISSIWSCQMAVQRNEKKNKSNLTIFDSSQLVCSYVFETRSREYDQLTADTSAPHNASIEEIGQLNANNTVSFVIGSLNFSTLITYDEEDETELIELEVDYTGNATAYNVTLRTYFGYYSV